MGPSPFLALDGAVIVDRVDEGVPGHYGNPIVEQRHLEGGRAIVDLSDRGVVTVTGLDRLTWLHSMSSQSLDRLRPGDSAETLFLDPSGHIQHVAHVIDDGETTWLIVEGPDAAPLAAWLQGMQFMLRVEVADRTEEFGVLGAMSTTALNAAVPSHAPNGVPLDWADPWSAPAPNAHRYAPDTGHPASGWHWVERIVPRSGVIEAAAAVRAGQVLAAGSLAEEALRLAAWRPRAVTEVDQNSIPHELDWLRSAVDLGKGCYRGQETVAKVVNLGRPPRRLVLLYLDGSDTVLPVRGDSVVGEKVRPEPREGEAAERRAIGHVTSSGMHHELGPIALAVVKRSIPSELPVIVESHGVDVAATQVEIVPVDAGPAVTVPRLPRFGIRA